MLDDVKDENAYGLTVARDKLLGTAEWGGKQTVKHSPKKLVRAIVRRSRTFTS